MQFEYDIVVPVPINTTGDLLVAYTPIISNIADTTDVEANFWSVTGSTIPQGARVQTLDDASTITMNMEAVNSDAMSGIEICLSKDTFPEPSGFDWFQNRTMWDRTNRWELLGPTSPQMDQWHKSGIVVTGPRRHFRQLGPYANNFQIWPPPTELTSPLQLVFEYMSLNAVMTAGSRTGPFTQYFEGDTDQPILDDQAIIMGIKWMFWEIKGFGSYVTLQNRWVDYVDRLIARDGAAPTLQLAKRSAPTLISPANVQDGFFPGPTE